MQTLPESDKDMYFGMVATNLSRNLGDEALTYAQAALQKMRTLGDEEGLGIWIEIEQRLSLMAQETAAFFHANG